MRLSILSFVLSVFIFIFRPGVSYSKELETCRSYVKSPDLFICLSSNNGNENGQDKKENFMGIPADAVVMDSGQIMPPDSAFFMEDENGGITDQPRVFNDFSDTDN